MKKDVKIVAVLFNNDNKILLEKHKDEFRLPSSSINDNERIEDAFKRFLLSDTGLTVEMLSVISAYNFDEINQVSIAFALTTLIKHKPIMELPSRYSWYSKNEIKVLKIQFPYREIIARAYFKHE